MAAYRSDPDRDRREAARQRYGYRAAVPIARLVGTWTSSADFRRLRRMRAVRRVLVALLGEDLAAQVEPVSLGRGGLTLAVADGALLAELRNHMHHQLLAALAEAGVATQQIRYRLKR